MKAKPRSKWQDVEKIDETHYIIAVKERPQDGRANLAVIRALAEHFDLAVSSIRLVSGVASKQKVFEIFS
ncbi:MAG: DUF167 domain-containing protein [Patescibacteria group bacterium]